MRNAVKIMSVFMLIASLFGCSERNVSDGDGMEYKDSEYRTEYANVLDFDSCDGTAFFAVAYLGTDEDGEQKKDAFVNSTFGELPKTVKEKMESFDFGGDKWFLIVPRYKDYVDITDTVTNNKHTVYNGEAFFLKCDSNVEISIDSHGGHSYIPDVDGNGKLVLSEDIWDISEYDPKD